MRGFWPWARQVPKRELRVILASVPWAERVPPLILLLAAVVLAAAGGLLIWNGNPPVHAQVISAPASPSGLAATAGLERVTLSWEDPGDSSITGYEYYQAAELAKLKASGGA